MKHLLITHNPNSIQMLPIIVILCFGKGNKKHLSASVCLYVCVFFLSELAEPTHRESETWGWQNTFYSAGVWTQDPVHAKQVLCHPGRWFTLYTNTFQGVTTRASEALLTVDHQHPHSSQHHFTHWTKPETNGVGSHCCHTVCWKLPMQNVLLHS